MPVLAGDRIAGRIALRARNGTAHLEGYQIADDHDMPILEQAARIAAAWAGAHTIHAGQIHRPAGLQP